MADKKSGAESTDTTVKSNDPGVTDTTKTDTDQSAGFDTKTIGDENFNKIFDDPRLWKHPRFKSLNERAKQAEKYEADLKIAEEKKLEEQKKFSELAELRAKERDEALAKYNNAMLETRILSEVNNRGVVDSEAVLKLLDRTNIKVGDDGNVSGVTEAVEALLESKPYLKGKNAEVRIGTGSAPATGATGNAPRFKLSQLQDAQFYRDNEKEINQAFKAGTIENDLT
jgi:hypothetical protein